MFRPTFAPDGPSPDYIDELLDEAEKKVLVKFSSPEAKRLAGLLPEECDCTKPDKDWDELEDILKDGPNGTHEGTLAGSSKGTDSIFSPNFPFPYERAPTQQNTEEKKCFGVYLSGSFEDMGYCVPGREKPCDKLKCLRCDCSVTHFDNFVWHTSTDYLFLRNNFPDFEKLASKLLKQRGSRAYACQCRHATATHLTNILTKPDLRWVCGTHAVPKAKQ